jgi:hypothetical protein
MLNSVAGNASSSLHLQRVLALTTLAATTETGRGEVIG